VIVGVGRVVLGIVPRGVLGFLLGVGVVGVSRIGMVGGLLMLAFFVVLSGSPVMLGGVLVVLGSFAVVLSSFVLCHSDSSFIFMVQVYVPLFA